MRLPHRPKPAWTALRQARPPGLPEAHASTKAQDTNRHARRVFRFPKKLNYSFCLSAALHYLCSCKK